MAIFRKIYPRCWQSMVELNSIEKLIALYILSGPQTNQCGIYQFSIGKAIEDLETLPQTFAKGFDRVLKCLSWKYDKKARIIYIPTWWKWNQPANPNVLIGNLKDMEELPHSSLISEFYANTKYLSDNLIKTFTQTLPQTLPQTVAESEEEEKEEEKEEELKNLRASELHENVLPTKKRLKKPANGYSQDFETFWSEIIHRPLDRKADAYKHWKQKTNIPPIQDLLGIVRRYNDSKNGTDPEHILATYNWIKNELYLQDNIKNQEDSIQKWLSTRSQNL